jgi:hypothetical protein
MTWLVFMLVAQYESLDCYVDADRLTSLSDNAAINLCRGSTTAGPVACYVAAESQISLTELQGAELCRCAESASPVACMQRGQAETDLTDEELLSLCAPVVVQFLGPNCAPISPVYPAFP